MRIIRGTLIASLVAGSAVAADQDAIMTELLAPRTDAHVTACEAIANEFAKDYFGISGPSAWMDAKGSVALTGEYPKLKTNIKAGEELVTAEELFDVLVELELKCLDPEGDGVWPVPKKDNPS